MSISPKTDGYALDVRNITIQAIDAKNRQTGYAASPLRSGLITSDKKPSEERSAQTAPPARATKAVRVMQCVAAREGVHIGNVEWERGRERERERIFFEWGGDTDRKGKPQDNVEDRSARSVAARVARTTSTAKPSEYCQSLWVRNDRV
jgi:hypothetical protein